MKNNFATKSILLIIANLVTGILNFTFTIVLSRNISPEGIGLYSLIFPIASLIMSVISGGIMTAVSKVIAEYYVKEQCNHVKKCVKITLYFNLVITTMIISLAFLFSYEISASIIKDIRTHNALKYVLVSIVFMVLSNTYKGYFYGTAKILIPAFIDIIEKLVRIFLILIIFKSNAFSSITTAVTTAFIIFCLGELISLICFFAYYQIDIRQLKKTKDKATDGLQLLYNILVISIPLMLTEMIGSIFHTITTLIVPRRLVRAGLLYPDALALIGKFASMSLQIVFFPIIIIGSIAVILIPDLSGSLSKQDYYTVKKRISQVITFSIVIGVAVFGVCFIFADKLGYLIYKRNDLGDYIRFLSFSAPILYTAIISRGVLNGLGLQKWVLKYSLIVSLIQVILLYVLVAIPSINIYGIGFTLIITSSINLALYIRKINKTKLAY